MAGGPSGGQRLSPNWNGVAGAQLTPIFVNGQFTGNFNVAAPAAGYGGDLWGAYGGGITPIGGGVSGPTGWDKPVANALSDTETAANYEIGALSNQVIQPPGIPAGAQVVSIIHFADSGNTFIDSALPSNTWTAGGTNGTATEVSTPTEFPGQGSLFISGYNAYINTPYAAGGSLDLTQVPNWSIDAWIYPVPATLASPGGQAVVFDFTANFATFVRLYTLNSGHIELQGFGTTWGGTADSVATVNVNAWNHVVAQRSGSNLYVGLNGALVSMGIGGNAAAIPASQFAYIGASANSGVQATGWLDGYICEHRMVKGAALFGTGTSYTVPTAPSGNPTIGSLPLAPPPTQTVSSQMANGALPTQTFDDTLVAGNSNAG